MLVIKKILCIISCPNKYSNTRVHTMKHGWLDWVDSRNKDGSESYAGYTCDIIDGIQMK